MSCIALLLHAVPLQREGEESTREPCYPHLYPALLPLLFPPEQEPASAVLHVTATRLKRGENTSDIRVTVCGEQAHMSVQNLLSALAERSALQQAHCSYQVRAVDLASPPWTAVNTWTDFLRPSSTTTLRLHFTTPMIVAATTETTQEAAMFPQPQQVFSALLRRWHQLHGPAFSLETDAWLQQGGCVVTNYRLQGVPIALNHETGSTSFYIGWAGWVDYTADKRQKACATMLRALARLACFTGTGLYTEYGLGVTRLVEKG